MIDATVCIPSFNDAEFLGRAIESAVTQASQVIVVDDGSTDGAVTAVASRYPIEYVRVTQRGLPNARNTGLMLARGRAFIPLDADDWLEPGFVSTASTPFSTADVVCVSIRDHGAREGLHRPRRDVSPELRWRENPFPYCAMYRTDVLRRVGGWNGRMVTGYEDWDLWLDLLSRGVRFGYADDAILNYTARNDSFTSRVVAAHEPQNLAEMRRHHGR